jgi:hypothetical protein
MNTKLIPVLLVLLACNSSDNKIKVLLNQKDSLELELIDSNKSYMQLSADIKRDSSNRVKFYDSMSAFYFEDLQLVQQYKDSLQIEQGLYNDRLNRVRENQMKMEESINQERNKVLKEIEELGK